MAKLAIKGMEFHAFHGYYEAERTSGGKYSVDVVVEIPDEAGHSDELSSTVNYEAIYAITQTVMAQPVRLIEHLAHRILEQLIAELGQDGKWTITVHKYNPPLDGPVAATSIELKG